VPLLLALPVLAQLSEPLLGFILPLPLCRWSCCCCHRWCRYCPRCCCCCCCCCPHCRSELCGRRLLLLSVLFVLMLAIQL